MKKLLTLICVLSFFLFYLQAKEQKSSLLDGIVIVLDAGHGGKDQGTTCKEISEATINLAIVKKLQHHLQQYGATIVLTRDGDYDLASNEATNRKKEDLKARMEIIQQNDADLFFSIHVNSFPSSDVQGIQLFYQKDNLTSKELTKYIHAHVQKVNDNILKDKEGQYYVLQESKIPSLLIECGFLSNLNDRELLMEDEYQNELTKAMCEGILDFFAFYY